MEASLKKKYSNVGGQDRWIRHMVKPGIRRPDGKCLFPKGESVAKTNQDNCGGGRKGSAHPLNIPPTSPLNSLLR